MLSFFPRGVLDEILNLIGSVSEDFPSCSYTIFRLGFNLDLDNFQVRLQYGVASLCNQLLSEFSSNQFETLHRCYEHIEDVHVTFSRQDNHF